MASQVVLRIDSENNFDYRYFALCKGFGGGCQKMQNVQPVVSAEYLGKFIHDTYVRPARERGDRVVTIRVREVCEALSHGYSENLVRGVLGSMKFRNAYRLPLVAADEHADGRPATFMFKLQRRRPGLFE